MFKVGQRVACINDTFEPWVYDLYQSLPKKDSIYTVRAIRAGRSRPAFELDDEARLRLTGAEFDILVLLQELKNPDDPYSAVKQELGFRAERFAPLLEETEEEEAGELIGVGTEKESWMPQAA